VEDGDLPGIVFLVFSRRGPHLQCRGLEAALASCRTSLIGCPFGAVFNCIWLLAWWSYIQACLVSPGVVPERWKEFVKESGIIVVASRRMWQPGMATLCVECDVPRPERAHHCIRCGTCILRFDHHCPWINNCVGFGNHKHFLLVSVYSWVLALLGCCSILPELLLLLFRMLDTDWDSESEVLGWYTPLVVIGAFAVDFQGVILLSQMLFCYLPLAACGLTRVEEMITRDSEGLENPYDRGSIVANLSQTFGAPGLDWLLPLAPRRPLSDGVSFPRSGNPLPPDEVASRAAAPTLLESCMCSSCCDLEETSEGRPVKDGRVLIRGFETEDENPETWWLRRYRVRRPPREAKKKSGFASSFLSGFLMCMREAHEDGDEERIVEKVVP